MQIHQVSAALDTKLQQLDQRTQELDRQIVATNEPADREQLTRDKEALMIIRRKLIKSKELAWQAHQLQQGNEEQQRTRQRMLGLTLCALSIIGAGTLIICVFML